MPPVRAVSRTVAHIIMIIKMMMMIRTLMQIRIIAMVMMIIMIPRIVVTIIRGTLALAATSAMTLNYSINHYMDIMQGR